MKVKSESEVAQSYPTLSDPRGLQPTRLLRPWIFQARVLEWGAIAFSEGKATHSIILASEFHGLYNPSDCKESDTTERLSLHFCFQEYMQQ